MKPTEIEVANGDTPHQSQCAGRRQFLTRSVAGGLAIALGGATLTSNARADGDDAVAADVPVPDGAAPATKADYELVVKPSDHPELATVGGYVTLDTKVGKIVVARLSETQFCAVGAVCTHKGGPIQYNADDKEFFCPWHKSKFDLQGAVLKGPAKIALPSYVEETVAVIKLS